MKLVFPKATTKRQSDALKICLAGAEESPARGEVVAALAAQAEGMEAGLRVIDRGLPVPGLGSIDILATDAGLRPVVICVADTLDSSGLCRGFLLADWVFENRELLGRMTGGANISGRALLWLVAKDIEPDAAALVRRIGTADFKIFTYRLLNLGGEGWLVFQRFAEESAAPAEAKTEANSPSPIKASPEPTFAQKRVVHLPIRSLLSEGEIDGIMGGRSIDDDEVTSRTSNFK